MSDAAFAAAVSELTGAITGDVDTSRLSRTQYATDASNYRVLPQVITFPRTASDVREILAWARRYKIPVTNRGGGTSTAGNSVGTGVIIEFSRYMNQILEIDPQARIARVQPGVVMSDLQAAAAPFGLRFGPDPSTQNRATFGGMIGNNACGPHAVAYGKTADNVLGLHCIDGLGREFVAKRGDQKPRGINMHTDDNARDLSGAVSDFPAVSGAGQNDQQPRDLSAYGSAACAKGADSADMTDSYVSAQVLHELNNIATCNLALIRTECGRFGRQVSGYSLEHLLPENGVDLAKFFVGTEGTLVTITEATLRLVPIAAAPMLVVLGYPDMPTAADAVPALLAHKPLAIEGMDAALVDMVRQHRGTVPELPAGNGWLMVEVGALEGDDAAEVPARAQALAAAAGTDAVMMKPAGPEATTLWKIRADGAGLGGRTPRGTQAWPGWEDSAVPPENLGSYLRDLQALMDKHGLHGLMYGHFGDGCVHVRIDFPIDKELGVPVFRDFLEQATDIAVRYGGSLSGEHGDGRGKSELLPRMYSPQAMELFAEIKTLFDPLNLMNPGVLVSPRNEQAARSCFDDKDEAHNTAQSIEAQSCSIDLRASTDTMRASEASSRPPSLAMPDGVRPIDADLRRPYAQELPYAGGFHFRDDGDSFTKALHHCTGVGKCRASGTWMCPSYQATKDEKDVTRGRMRILQDITQRSASPLAKRTLLAKGFADSAVHAALDLCLGCKACGKDCPTGVDVARFKSEALYRGYKGKLRPRTHYILGNLPRLARIATAIPGVPALANLALSVTPLRKLAFTVSGLDTRRLMPGFATKRFSRIATKVDHAQPLKVDDVRRRAHEEDSRYVMLWADSFSETLDTRGAHAMVELLQRHGYTVLIPPEDVCCGLTWITTGQLDTAKAKLRHLLTTLAPFAAEGIPIVGVEPSCTAVLRDDVLDLLPDDARSALVSSMTFTLAELLTHATFGPKDLKLPDLHGVKIVAQPHCHHYSVMGWNADAALLRQAGAELQILTGCCGLAGNFGMEKGHYDVSVKVAQRELLPALNDPENEQAVYLADGFSCRTQAQQLAGKDGVHLAQLLLHGVTAGNQ